MNNGKKCPFNGYLTNSPHDVVEAFSDQLHSDILFLRQISFLPESDSKNDGIKHSLGIVRKHLDELESLTVRKHITNSSKENQQ